MWGFGLTILVAHDGAVTVDGIAIQYVTSHDLEALFEKYEYINDLSLKLLGEEQVIILFKEGEIVIVEASCGLNEGTKLYSFWLNG